MLAWLLFPSMSMLISIATHWVADVSLLSHAHYVPARARSSRGNRTTRFGQNN
jgi:hypothetical protein